MLAVEACMSAAMQAWGRQAVTTSLDPTTVMPTRQRCQPELRRLAYSPFAALPPPLALLQKLNELQDAVATQQKARVFDVQQEALGYVGTIEEAMVRGFPFEVPSQYANLPQLKVSR